MTTEIKINDLLSVGDAARLLGVSKSTIRRWEKLKKIRSVRTPGGHRRFSASELRSFYEDTERTGIIFSFK
jgi:excisionase family DNA binding protein